MTIDGGRPIDWGRTSSDYAAHRPGPPPSYYERLAALGVVSRRPDGAQGRAVRSLEDRVDGGDPALVQVGLHRLAELGGGGQEAGDAGHGGSIGPRGPCGQVRGAGKKK